MFAKSSEVCKIKQTIRNFANRTGVYPVRDSVAAGALVARDAGGCLAIARAVRHAEIELVAHFDAGLLIGPGRAGQRRGAQFVPFSIDGDRGAAFFSTRGASAQKKCSS